MREHGLVKRYAIMTWHEKSEIVGRLQTACAAVFELVVSNLQIGMSETHIADMVRTNLNKHGISDYWYDVPIFVLIGADRFQTMDSTDYDLKSPTANSLLRAGSPLYIDMHPVDTDTKLWGDWNSMVVFQPRPGNDDEELSFLHWMRELQRSVIRKITSSTTGAEVSQYFAEAFQRTGTTLLDVRDTVGHSVHSGAKAKADRIWLDRDNSEPLGEGIFTVEPGGIRTGKHGEVLVARFEDCIYIPKTGSAIVLDKAWRKTF